MLTLLTSSRVNYNLYCSFPENSVGYGSFRKNARLISFFWIPMQHPVVRVALQEILLEISIRQSAGPCVGGAIPCLIRFSLSSVVIQLLINYCLLPIQPWFCSCRRSLCVNKLWLRSITTSSLSIIFNCLHQFMRT